MFGSLVGRLVGLVTTVKYHAIKEKYPKAVLQTAFVEAHFIHLYGKWE